MKKILVLSMLFLSAVLLSAQTVALEPKEMTTPEPVGQIRFEGVNGGTAYFVSEDEAWNISGTECKFVFFDQGLTESEKKQMLSLVMMAYALDKNVQFRVNAIQDHGSTITSYFIVEYVIVGD